jgi:hypothetical protein
VDYAVLHKITVPGAGTRLEARLIVTGAPDGTTTGELRGTLDDAGRSADWNDGGIPWGNHDIRHPNPRTGAWPRGTLIPPDTPRVTWDQLQADSATAIKRLGLRVPLSLYAAIVASATREHRPIQGWSLDAYRTHLLWTQTPAEHRRAIEQAPDPAAALEQALTTWAQTQTQEQELEQDQDSAADQRQGKDGDQASGRRRRPARRTPASGARTSPRTGS